MKTNKDQVVIQSVQGIVHHPTAKGDGYWVGYDGKGRISMSVGGITYNYRIGDSCMHIPGDHVEPGVSLTNPDAKEGLALMSLACIGNPAKIISGDAKGRCGFVTGKHGGINHVIIYFDEETLELLNINDRIAIKACGLGLQILDHQEIFVMNIDPALFEKLAIKECDDGALEIGVTHIIPAYLMGSGLGETTMMNGDYDIMMQDHDTISALHLNTLRFGDLVYIEDHDNAYGPHYHKGSGSVGIIVHSDSFTSGHGPGVTIIMTAQNYRLKPVIDPSANLANLLLSDKKHPENDKLI